MRSTQPDTRSDLAAHAADQLFKSLAAIPHCLTLATMSFNSNRRATLDEKLPLEHRASHARSCAIHVANKLGLERDAVIDLVLVKAGVDLHHPNSGAELLLAIDAMEALRIGEVPAPQNGNGGRHND
jgi:hypothetical protein